ncbi:toxin TcdB middle/N-terminal domain-containing protein [Rhizobium ruizarguesonis]|nr:toxin TcdB middle/N-terminal domain-containing protein [Rhizobium ruizarguesonis]
MPAIIFGALVNPSFAEPLPDKTGTSPSVLSLPSGPGSIEGLGKSFEPLLNTGGAAFTIPIELPPGPAGWSPRMSLSYNSELGNSSLGQGWTLSVGLSIERQSSKGFPRYRDSDTPTELRDVFVFQGEELVPLTDGTYRLRTEEQHRRFQPIASTPGGPLTAWLVEDPNGGRHWLGRYYDDGGSGRSSRVVHPFPETVGLNNRSPFEKTFQWLEDAAEDANGNRIEYDYARSADSPGLLYLEAIRYFPGGSRDAYQLVNFFTESRPDVFRDQQAGFPRKLGRRFREIAVGSFFDGVLHPVRSYALSYAVKDGVFGDLINALPASARPIDTGVGRLYSVTQFGSNRDWGGVGSPGTPLPPERFSYSGFLLGPLPEHLASKLSPIGLHRTPYESEPLGGGPTISSLRQLSDGGDVHDIFDVPFDKPEVQFADINGDGLPDLLDTRVSSQKPHYTVAMNLGRGLFGPSRSVVHPDGVDLGQSSSSNQTVLLDHGGKGIVDLVSVSGLGQARTTRIFPNLASSLRKQNGLGFESKPMSEVQTGPEVTLLDPDVRLVDLDFDKSPDVLLSDASGLRGYRAAENGGWTSMGVSPWTSASSGLTDDYRFSIERGPTRVSNPLVQLADLAGDRLPNLVRLAVRAPGVAELRYSPMIGPMLWGKEVVFESALPDGQSSGMPAELQLPGLTTSAGPSWDAIRLADINGDGLPDLVYVQDKKIIVYLNCSGSALVGPFVIENTPRYTPEDPTNPTVLRVLDVNGNGVGGLVFYQPASRKFEFIDFQSGQKSGLLQVIDNGIGLRTFIRYKPISSDLVRANRSQHPWRSVSPLPTWVVAGVIEDVGVGLGGDGAPSQYVKTINYRDPFYDGLEKRFQGFAFVETIEWGDDVDASGLPRQTPQAGAEATAVTRYRFFTGAPDGEDHDEYVDGFDVEPRRAPGTMDQWTLRGGRKQEPLRGKQILIEVAHGSVLGDAAGDFDKCAEAAADAAAAAGQYSKDALRFSPDKYTYQREVNLWTVRRLYRPPGAVAPRGRLLRTLQETVAVPDVSVSFPVLRRSTTEHVEANGLMRVAFDHPKAPVPYAPSRTVAVEYDFDDFGNRTLTHELGTLLSDGGPGDEERKDQTNFALQTAVTGRVDPWIIDRPVTRRLEAKDGAFVREDRFYYDGPDFVGLPSGKLGNRGILKRRQSRVLDASAALPGLDRAPTSPDDVSWLSIRGDPRDAGGGEWVDVDRAAYDEFGNRVATMDALGEIGSDGAPAPNSGHYVKVTFDPVFHTLPTKEQKEVGGGHAELVFEASYGKGNGTPARWGFGTPAFSINPNGNRTHYDYDLFGRLTAILRPGDKEAFPSISYRYRLGDPHRGLAYDYDRRGALSVVPISPLAAANSVKTEIRETLGSAETHSSITFTTGKMQRVLVLEEDEGGSYNAVKAARFGARGTPVFQAQPYRQVDDSFQGVPAGTAGTALAIDAIGREILRLEPPESSVSGARQVESRVQFLPLSERHFDAEELSTTPGGADHTGSPSIREVDGLGRLIQLTETVRTSNGLENWITHYGWNAESQLTWVRDSQDNLRWTRFDGLGRGIAHFDLNRGPLIYSYDAAGNLVETGDAKRQSIRYGYDGLNRLVTEEYGVVGAAPKPRPDVMYRYDEPEERLVVNGASVPLSNTRGFLVSVRDLSGEEYTSYDERGRPDLTVKRVLAPDSATVQEYTIQKTYDSANRVRRITYPDGTSADYSYDKSGKAKSITASFGGIIRDRTYNAAGLRQRTEFANGVSTQQTYDPRLRPASIVTTSSDGRALVDYGYLFDGASNLLTITDNRSLSEVGAMDPRRNDQTFIYDDAYRLVHATFPLEEAAYGYDRLGSMTDSQLTPRPSTISSGRASEVHFEMGPSWHRVAGQTIEPGVQALQATSDGKTFEYDANGNIQRQGGTKLSWDVKDRLIAVDTKEAHVEYRYDYAGRRIVRLARESGPGAQTHETLYPFRWYETVDGASLRYIFDGETRIARVDPRGHAIFYHPDHLGSVAAMTDSAGRLFQENELYPFGQVRNRSRLGDDFSPDYLFIQKEHDPVSDLSDFEARQLIGSIGRFAAVEPLSSNIPKEGLLHPQLLNGYAYGANNPLKFYDGSGTWAKIAFELLAGEPLTEGPKTNTASNALPSVPGGSSFITQSTARATAFANDRIDTSYPELRVFEIAGAISGIGAVYEGGVELFESLFAAEEAGEGAVSLFRAIGQDEAQSFLSEGGYAAGPSGGGKYFASNLDGPESAMNFATHPFNSELGTMTMTQVNVPESFLSNGTRFFDPGGAGSSIHFGDEFLPQLNQFGPKAIGQ